MTPEQIISSRESFNDFVYVPWQVAAEELERRTSDTQLQNYIEKRVHPGIPEIMKGKKSIVLFRHVATPNYEIHRFLTAADALSDFQPLILEYTKDKFTNRNDWKFSLGKISFHKGHSKKNELLIENKTIIDINSSNFKPIDSLITHWGQNLVDFHHELFDMAFPQYSAARVDLSEWLHSIGPAAKDYYKSFLGLFLKDAILFENFLVEGKEKDFTREIILPAFLEIMNESGHKPLIVALEPTDIEGDHFWLTHPFSRKIHVENKQSQAIDG